MIYSFGFCTGFYGLEGLFMSCLDPLVHFFLFLSSRSSHKRSCHIRMVMLVKGSYINNDEVTVTNFPVCASPVSICRTDPRGHNRLKPCSPTAFLAHSILEFRCNLYLSDSRRNCVSCRLHARTGHISSFAHELKLFLVFHASQLRDDAALNLQPRAATEGLGKHLVEIIAHRVQAESLNLE